MAHGGFLSPGPAAKTMATVSAAIANSEKKGGADDDFARRSGFSLMRRIAIAILVLTLGCSGCAIHQFAEPTRQWTTRNGQLSYHGPKRAFIGEVLVRFSTRGDFELTFTKGPGVTLLLVRSDPEFARVQGPLVGLPWSGPIASPPVRAQGWLVLRREILRNPQKPTVRVSEGGETFVLRF